MQISSRIAALLAALCLSGCAGLLRSDYVRPALTLPAQWRQAGTAAEGSPAVQPRWWQAFGDEQLDGLVADMLLRNNDLAAAGVRMRRAWLEAGLAAGRQQPALGASAEAASSTPLRRNRSSERSDSAKLTVSYEADFWGRLARSTDAAEWEAHASAEDRASLAWSLTGTTVRLYWQIASLNQRIALADANLLDARRMLDIVGARHAAGASSGLEMLQSEQTLAALEADRSALLQTRVEARNALAILFGAPAATPLPERAALPEGALPAVEAGLPADLLGRRPDLRAAELRLRETLASGDAVRASYYPDLSLTGSLGSSSSALLRLLDNPVATLGAGISLPFLQWSEMQRSVGISQADYDKAVLDFRQNLASAIVDVENALSARTRNAEQALRLEQSLRAAQKIEQIHEVQYRAGAIALKSWLDAKQSLRDAESKRVQNRYSQLAGHVVLIQALGGSPDAAAADVR